jgi:hypothetical protein
MRAELRLAGACLAVAMATFTALQLIQALAAPWLSTY